MVIKVMSKSQAKRESFKLNIPTAIISITDRFDIPIKFHKSNFLVEVLNLHFDDEIEGLNIMTEADCFNIKSFVDRNKNKVTQIIIHCEAGVSRSPAIAAAVMLLLNQSDNEIWNNPKFCPNEHCFVLMNK